VQTMSNFKAIIDLFGLSAEEAAVYLKAEPADIVRWCTTNDSPPIEVWQAVVTLFDTIRFAAEDAAKATDLDDLEATDLNGLSFPPPARLAANANGPLKGPERTARAMAVASLARVFV